MPDQNKILVFPFPLQSHYLRCIQLCEDFYSQEQVFFSYDPKYAKDVLRKGFLTFDCKNFDPGKVMPLSEKFDFSWLNRKDIESIFIEQVNVIQQMKPHLVIGDTSPTLKMAAEFCSVQYIALMNAYMTPYYAKTRNVPRNHKAYSLLKKLKPTVADQITNFAERLAFKQVHKPFKKLRKKYRLKKVESYIFETQGDINLLCDTPELFPQKNLPDNYHFIGPLVPLISSQQECSIDDRKPNVLVCMGSSGNWNAMKFLADKKYQHLNIITAGDLHKTLSGNHIQSYDFINLDTVLPHCDLLICHGGNGTIHYGLKHEVRMLFYTSHFEQEWNAERMQELGFGNIINDLNETEIAALVFETAASGKMLQKI